MGFVGSGDRMAKGGGNWGAVTGLVGVGWAVGYGVEESRGGGKDG